MENILTFEIYCISVFFLLENFNLYVESGILQSMHGIMEWM